MNFVPSRTNDKWNFNADATGKWRWSVTSADREVLRTSAQAYRTRAEAVADAKQHGYVEADFGGTSVPGLRRFRVPPQRA